MKILLILTLLATFVLSQNDCNNFRTHLSLADKHYAELSPSRRNYIDFILKQKDSVAIKIVDKNEVIFKESYGILDAGKYLIRFYNPNSICPSYRMLFAKLIIGTKSYGRIIEISDEEINEKQEFEKPIPFDSNSVLSSVDGVWKRSYSSVYFPSAQPDVIGEKTFYNYLFNIQIVLSNNSYEILSERIERKTNYKNIEKFKGNFILKNDSLSLFEKSKFIRLFKCTIERDTLNISNFVSKDKSSGMMIAPINININSRKPELIGKYHYCPVKKILIAVSCLNKYSYRDISNNRFEN